MRQCPDVALSSLCVQAVRESSLPPSEPDVLIKRLDPDVPLPTYAHPGDAGVDLSTAEDVELGPGERARDRAARRVRGVCASPLWPGGSARGDAGERAGDRRRGLPG